MAIGGVGKRSVGRPLQRWMDDLIETCLELRPMMMLQEDTEKCEYFYFSKKKYIFGRYLYYCSSHPVFLSTEYVDDVDELLLATPCA